MHVWSGNAFLWLAISLIIILSIFLGPYEYLQAQPLIYRVRTGLKST